jgi:hypothetical protein
MDDNPYRTPRSDCRKRHERLGEEYNPPATDWSAFFLILFLLVLIHILQLTIIQIISWLRDLTIPDSVL